MKLMGRRFFLGLLALPLLCSTTTTTKTTVRGELTKSPDGQPALKTPDGKLILLEGDKDTTGVLKDKRLAGADFEAAGEFVAPDRFRIGPIYTKSMWVHKNGKKLMITYWCDLCSIRTYTPGICWCCQQETNLDLVEPDDL